MAFTRGEVLRILNDGVLLEIRDGLFVPVVVKDLKPMRNRYNFLVTPVNGEGEIWVNETQVKLIGT